MRLPLDIVLSKRRHDTILKNTTEIFSYRKKIHSDRRRMNISCSICLESFTQRSDISTTLCGHVFHTNCIQRWLQNGRKICSQCRKGCKQTIKLYFSENESDLQDHNALIAVEKENLKLHKENLELRTENHKIQDLKRENLKLQQDNQRMAEEKLKFQKEANDAKTLLLG